MKFYIRKKDLIEAENYLDPGEHVKARMYVDPHPSMLDSLVECTTVNIIQMTDDPSGMNPEGQ